MVNMQLLHECKDSRDAHMKNCNKVSNQLVTNDMVEASHQAEEDDMNATVDEITLHELLNMMSNQNSDKIM